MTNTLLTELDGLNDRNGVYVIAATNRPEIIDAAMIRPGRLDHPLFVALPTPEERVEILTALTRKTPLSDGMDLRRIALDERAANFRYMIPLKPANPQWCRSFCTSSPSGDIFAEKTAFQSEPRGIEVC